MYAFWLREYFVEMPEPLTPSSPYEACLRSSVSIRVKGVHVVVSPAVGFLDAIDPQLGFTEKMSTYKKRRPVLRRTWGKLAPAKT